MHIVVHVSVYEKQVALEIFHEVLIHVYAVVECGISFSRYVFLDTVVSLAPPAVVDTVVVVSGAGDSCFVEIGVGKYGSCGHESSSGVSMYSNFVDIHIFTL